ncbi:MULTISPECIES: DUF309 domain-containing protein [Dietzia]|uniref:DUF309 domain-containing protein n=1 Tax=Dietzia TaxID=37914 RepID=UPI000D08AEAC|nr:MULTISPECIES: DUF309 domain-containing protein [Dietzia]AVM65977.1 DUF309 domain-containing protein [Dietzia sp. oral taxon 368]MCT1712596.1 DUF309 domain-containing protein [Dietzia cinnamea]MCT2265063.1 DUF309 domain-containing protein [Dietzia cinnamea]MCT2275864.1 DUF309 domain-containing protein [Dietzia cinnamea]
MSTSPRSDRDRDEEGRARNARPRDELGRPLPPGSVGVERIPEDLDLPPAESLAWAQDLLDRGRAFHAHEVLEGAWKSGPADERLLWQGLAQLAVGITHIQRANAKGAMALLERAAERLAHGDGPAPHGVDATGLVAYAHDLMAELRRGGSPAPDRLRPRLVRRRVPDDEASAQD